MININKETNKSYPNFLIIFFLRYGIFFILFLSVIIFGLFNPRFLTFQNLTNISIQIVPIGLLALGSMFVIISGGLDLSAGVGVSVAAIMIERVWVLTNNITFSVISGFLTVLIIGLINGLLITKIKLNSIITTLVMMSIVTGAINIIFQLGKISLKIDTPLFPFLIQTKILGIPLSFLIMILFYLIGYMILNHTRFGIYILAIGNNSEGARIAGINIYNYMFYTYIISGFSMGLASLILLARVTYVNPNLGGTAILLDAITALIIGGVLIGGGKGSIRGVFIGTISIVFINSMINMINIQPAWNAFFKGFVIIAMMVINRTIQIIEEKNV